MMRLVYGTMVGVGKIKTLITRYAPQEIAGTITALAAASIAYSINHSLLAAAIAGPIGEGIGYYGVAITREVRHYYRKHRHQARLRRLMLTVGHAARGLLVEFGPADALDSLLVRPFLFYWAPQFIHIIWLGWLVAKIISDIVFYVFAAIGYEIRKQLWHDVPEPAEQQEG